MFASAVLLSLVVISSVSCGVVNPSIQDVPDGRIIKGQIIDISAAPYMASITYNERLHCAGGIISPTFILTAAHCWYSSEHFPNLTLQVGSSNYYRSFTGTSVPIEHFVKHPNYNDVTFDMDVALIKLSRNLILSDNIKPYPLNPNLVLGDGHGVVITGWGHTKWNGHPSDELMKAIVYKISLSSCRNHLGNHILTNNMFCAYSLGSDACQGDSGGPVVRNGIIVGIVSWGLECGTGPGVYTNLSSPQVYNFINRQMQIL